MLISGLLKMYKKINPTRYSEIESIPATRIELQKAGRFPNVPLTVVSAGRRAGNKKTKALITQLHKELAALSTKGVFIIDQNSGHIIQHDNPQLVIRVIRDTIDNN